MQQLPEYQLIQELLMERNPSSTIERVWTPVADINDHILSWLSVFDLLRFARTCKDFRQYLNKKGWLESLEKLVFKYDLEYLPEKISWLKVAARYEKIDHSIRNGFAVVNCIATPALPEEGVQDGLNVITFNEDYAALNWTITEGVGSGTYDVVGHSGVLDIYRRTLVQTRNGPKAIRVLGAKLGVTEIHGQGGGDSFYFGEPIVLKEYDDAGLIEGSDPKIVANAKARGIVTNRDPNMKHIIAIVGPIIKSDSLLDRSDLEVVIYDTKAAVELTKVVLVDASEAQIYTRPISVVLKGKLLYYSENIHPVSASTLHVIDWTTPNHTVVKKLILPGTWSDLYGVHKSYVYGVTAKDWNDRSIYVYNMDTGKYLEWKKREHYSSTALEMLGGYLVHKENSAVYFMDYRGDKLRTVSSLSLGARQSGGLLTRQDGTLMISSLYPAGSLHAVDLENTCDQIEVMVMSNKLGQVVVMNFQAHELPAKMSALLGKDFVSRYYRIKKDFRCGIIFRRQHASTDDRLELSQRYFRHKAQYNTPYFYHHTQTNEDRNPEFPVEMPRYTESGLWGTVVFFYEVWDGTRFKLAKPRDWEEILLKK